MEGSIKITVTSKKLKAVALAKWVIRKSFEKIVEEKDPSLALLSDDIQHSDNQMQSIRYQDVRLQGEIEAKYQQQSWKTLC